jgi:hypothetical protein
MLVKIVTFQWNKINFESLFSVRVAILLSFSVVLAACSAPSELKESRKDELIQRVTERWRCLERNDYACAYEYLSPEYRAVFSYEMYRNRYFSNLERVLTGVKVVAYDRDAAVASVRVGVMSSSLKSTPSALRASMVTPATLDEAWLWEGSAWWYHDGW